MPIIQIALHGETLDHLPQREVVVNMRMRDADQLDGPIQFRPPRKDLLQVSDQLIRKPLILRPRINEH